MPNSSLLTLRTFYAYGARNGRIPSLQRTLSYNARGNSLCVGSLQQFTETSHTLQRSFTASSIYSPKRSTTYHNRQYFTSSSNISKSYSSAIINTLSSNHAENDTGLQCCEQPVNVAAVPEIKNEISKAPEDSAEMIALIDKNKSLEEEVKQLTLKLREKERSERECRSESKGNEEISDIMEQLNNAAEKLTRLDAVKDLKLLQSEMETALREISK
ncbi:unnamed protein product [Cercopithifilaria johnstoni]|uniref:Uncharacterized protein n=1 Tax=Cercopithifilaria johnstoni TaxID=2874296 RepID=A0A8J2MD02_9BILA|nr:unnamed protein product [Cercopithifilaria johnstoni]